MPPLLTATDRFVDVVRAHDDETLVALMLDAMSPHDDGFPMVGGATDTGADATRAVFAEIACRWIPVDVREGGLRRHMDLDWEGGNGDQ